MGNRTCKASGTIGLIDRRDVFENELATRLGRDVLAPILDALPSGVRRLQLIPDGILWQLPFDALRLEPGGIVLAAFCWDLIRNRRNLVTG